MNKEKDRMLKQLINNQWCPSMLDLIDYYGQECIDENWNGSCDDCRDRSVDKYFKNR
jgi:hypothetical protein